MNQAPIRSRTGSRRAGSVALSVLALCASLAACAHTGQLFGVRDEVPQLGVVPLERFASAEEFTHHLDTLLEAEGRDLRHRGIIGTPCRAPRRSPFWESAPVVRDTEVQDDGLEGADSVQTWGDYLVVLRRGRLFSVRLGSRALRPVSMVDAFAPTTRAPGWYDQLLLHGHTLVVVGYSHDIEANEIGLFHIDDAGQIRHRASYYLHGCYSLAPGNATLLRDGRLILFTAAPEVYSRYEADGWRLYTGIPTLRGATEQNWQPLVSGPEVFRLQTGTQQPGRIHTVLSCDLERLPMRCDARAVVAPTERQVVYLSRTALYLWAQQVRWQPQQRVDNVLYRVPLDSSAVSALSVDGIGGPADRFSFNEERGHLDVLLREDNYDEGRWANVEAGARVSLLRVPLSRFAPGGERPARRVHLPPALVGTFKNRFVGDHVLYGSASYSYGEGDAGNEGIFVYPYTRPNARVTRLPLYHGVEQIGAFGQGAIVVGSDEHRLVVTTLELGDPARIIDRYIGPLPRNGEPRSNGLFYGPTGAGSGVVGLPLRHPRRGPYVPEFDGSASVRYLRLDKGQLTPMGELASSTTTQIDDGCRASCIEWYGDTRPIFHGDRVFGLMGYELVEGIMRGGRLVEARRIDLFTERPASPSR